MHQTIAVLDFGSQLTQVIARRIRECQVYSKIYHYATPAAKLREENVAGIILSGGPQSVYGRKAPHRRQRYQQRQKTPVEGRVRQFPYI